MLFVVPELARCTLSNTLGLIVGFLFGRKPVDRLTSEHLKAPRGIEICCRLFDAGKSRYAVAALMDISFGAATHRLDAWKKLGGVNRNKQPLE
jgi:hypothetical protein